MLHHTQKKAAIKKMKEANPDITDIEIEAELEKMESLKDDPEETYPSGRVAPAGKKLYDKWRGQWRAVQKVKNPFNNEEKVVKWQFEYLESKPNRTRIPMTESEAELFNKTRKMPLASVPCEQLTIHGTKPEVFQDLTADFQPVSI